MFKNFTIATFFIIAALSLFFQFYKQNEIPPCLNDDEAAHGYTAYSILKTGRDEHGNTFPLRFKSFGDYKLPLYSYLSVPFIQIFGTTETGARAVNALAMLLIPVVLYFVGRELFKDKWVILLASFLVSMSVWTHVLSRMAHEGVLAALFVLLSFLFVLKFSKRFLPRDFILANLFILLATFAYHYGRIFIFFIILWQIYILIKQKRKNKLSGTKLLAGIVFLIIILSIPFSIDLLYSANRAKFLLFINNPGFLLRILEYLIEHPVRIIHNKLFEFIREGSYRYVLQFSPNFFLHGVDDFRYSIQYLSFLTITEYVFVFCGLYYLFKNKEKSRYIIIISLLLSAIPNALTFQTYGLGRNYMMIFPIVLISSYGVFNFLANAISEKYKVFVGLIIGLSFVFYSVNSWDIYFNHYPKRAIVVRAWQCGRRELADYIKQNYNKFDEFVITNKHGQAYMFLLYYLSYDPAKYQSQKNNYYEYSDGFLTVSKFDKYNFVFKFDSQKKGVSYIGYPDDFNDQPINPAKIKKIRAGTEEIFWVYENPR